MGVVPPYAADKTRIRFLVAVAPQSSSLTSTAISEAGDNCFEYYGYWSELIHPTPLSQQS